MELTKVQKIYGARLGMAMMLFADVTEHKYETLQTLCETLGLSNKRVVNRLKESNKIVLYIPSEQIYYDWLYVIFDESEYNKDVLTEFYNLSKKRFSYITEYIEKLEKYYSKNQISQCIEVVRSMQKKKIRTDALLFYLCYSNIITDIDSIGIDYNGLIYAGKGILFSSEKKQDEYLLNFNTGEQVMTSLQFKKYLKARREELAEYMSTFFEEEIEEQHLGAYLDDVLSSKASNHGVEVEYSLGGIIKTACRNILIEHGGGLDWYESITSRKGSSFACNLNYIPNVDDIIEKYYIQLMRYNYIQEDEFSKRYLIRECKSESPLIDLISIMFMYNVDVFTKMFMNLLEDYYINFSWEKVVNQSGLERYKSIITTLEAEIQSMCNKLERADNTIRIFNEQLRKEKNAEIIPLEKINNELEKRMEEKDAEIENLKQQIKSRDEFIELLENAVEDRKELETIDLPTLQTKKYLFVGNAKEALPELHKKFVNSLFMENESFSLTNIKVDAIVMLIKYMSHGMYYKIRSANTLNDIPIVRCNTKNIDTIYNAMSKIIN